MDAPRPHLEALPKGHEEPAIMRKKIMQPQNVQKQMPKTSHRVGGLLALNIGLSSATKHQKANKYGIAPKAVLRISLAVILIAPFTLFAEIFVRSHEMSMPVSVMTSAFIQASAIHSAIWIIDSFMGGPSVDGDVGISIVNQGGPPTNSKRASQSAQCCDWEDASEFCDCGCFPSKDEVDWNKCACCGKALA
jgi:hypothetical protein